VTLLGVEDALLKNVQGYLEIWQFNGAKVPSVARLRYLHRIADRQIEKALQPFGYYRASVESSLEQQDDGWHATYRVSPGEAIVVTRLDLKVVGPGEDDPQFRQALAKTRLRQGEPLDQQAYEALKKRLQVIASERGYFDAKLEKNEIRVDLKRYVAEIMLHFATGARYRLGDVVFRQEKKDWLSEEMLRRYVEIEPGQFYEAGDLQQLQGDLSNSEYYKQVEINASPEAATDRVIPVEVLLKPQKPRKYVYGIGYGTDTGVRAKAGVTGRRVNSRGHHYKAEALVSEIKYGIAGEYIIPGEDPRADAWGLRSSWVDEHSDTRNYQAYSVGGYYRYRQGFWLKTYALDYRVERFEVGDETPTSTLLIPSAEWTRTLPTELEKRIYVENGAWLRLFVRGGADALLSDTSFIQPLVAAKWVRSFENRHRLIGRAALGTTWVSDFDALPTSLRFFTGGDRTVRGYKYSVIGPVNADNDVVGGKHLIEASVEYEFPISEKWSIAAFVDSGDAFDDSPDYKTGVGLGLHWRSPIGPVRIDFGRGLTQPVGNKLLLHLSIGPDL
jgi:translocation and assembly module TamA